MNVTEITARDLDQNPEYAVGLLNYAYRQQVQQDPNEGYNVMLLPSLQLYRRYDYAAPEKEFYRLLVRNWIYGEQLRLRQQAKADPGTGRWSDPDPLGDSLSCAQCHVPTEFERLYRQQKWAKVTNKRVGWTYIVSMGNRGELGRPVTPMRHAAVLALMLRVYLKKPWREIIRKVCPCGDSHRNSNKVAAQCQPNLEAQVRLLKRLLRDCNIELSGTFPASAIMPNGLSEPKKDSLKMAAPTAVTQTERRIEELKRQLTELGPMHPGNLSEQQYKVCDTPGCRCKDSRAPRKHGPYHVLSFKLGDKSSSYVVRPEQAEEMRVKLVNFERFRELTSEWVKLAVELERAEREQAKHADED